MQPDPIQRGAMLRHALVDSLYAEALLLADEARAWFDRTRAGHGAPDAGRDDPLFDWAGRHDPALRVALSCESLRLTTRLMHAIAWLLMQRAVAAGEISEAAAREEASRLGESPPCDASVVADLPPDAVRLIEASRDLHRRVAHLEAGWLTRPDPAGDHPVHRMHGRIAALL